LLTFSWCVVIKNGSYIVLSLCLSALTGEALAQSRAGQKEVRLDAVFERGSNTDGPAVYFHQVQAPSVVPVEQLHPFAKRSLDVINQIGRNGNIKNKLSATQAKFYDKKSTFTDRVFRARLLEGSKTQEGVSTELVSTFQSGLGEELEGSVPFVREFESGKNFDLPLASMFKSTPEAKPADTIRYGTEIRDIQVVDQLEPSMDSKFFLAAASTPGVISDEELAFSQPAQVSYSVKQVSINQRNKDKIQAYVDPFAVKESAPFYAAYSDQILDPNFGMNVRPVAGDVDLKRVPQMDIALQQSTRFYLLKYQTPAGLMKETSGVKQAATEATPAEKYGKFEHHLNLALYENKQHQFRLGLTRQYNQDFEALTTGSRTQYRNTMLMTSYDHTLHTHARGVAQIIDRYTVIFSYGGWVGDGSAFNAFKGQPYFAGVIGSF
jgi:hypothetical protein